ncbi:MAG: hypothetical protein MPN21_20990 [Thermoanaerobaculia bacterium]|nr:hypothetical protein [Thermoanaerobaculia bacterium]
MLLLWVTLTSGTVLADATPVGDEFQINAYTTGIQGLPNAAVAPDGSFVVIWESDGQDGDGFGTFLRRFDRQGNALTGDLQVAENTFSDQVDADVAMYSDGSFVVVWDADGASDGSYRGIFGRCFDSAGAPVGGEFAVNQGTLGDQNDAVIAPTVDGGFVVVWESHPPLGTYEDLLARRFDSSAQPVGNDYQINVFTTGDQEDADIAVDGSGNFVVVWESDAQDGSYDGVFGRRLDSSGQPLGDEFAVNTYVPGDQDNPSLAVRSDGSFVVAWEDNTQLGLDDSIWARFFDSTGSPTTTPFQVETATGVQFLPRVAIDSEGQAVVVWEGEEAGDPSMADVYYRVFEDTGQALTNEATIPLQDDGNQTLPVVAFNGIGDGIVAWMTNIHDGDAVGVFARRLGSPIFTDGFESGNTAAWSITVD